MPAGWRHSRFFIIGGVASASEIRPRPPKVVAPAAGYQCGDVVDAFDNDGWWVGRITGRLGDHRYCISFDDYRGTYAYHKNHLRFHEDWILAAGNSNNRVWVFAS